MPTEAPCVESALTLGTIFKSISLAFFMKSVWKWNNAKHNQWEKQHLQNRFGIHVKMPANPTQSISEREKNMSMNETLPEPVGQRLTDGHKPRFNNCLWMNSVCFGLETTCLTVTAPLLSSPQTLTPFLTPALPPLSHFPLLCSAHSLLQLHLFTHSSPLISPFPLKAQ